MILTQLGCHYLPEIKCQACQAFYLFFARSLINSIIQEHEPALTAAINDSDTAGMSLPARDKMPGLPCILSLFRNKFNKFNNTRALVGWFCCFTSQVNSYGHCGTVSSPNHTFSWAGLNKRLTSNLCTYFRL